MRSDDKELDNLKKQLDQANAQLIEYSKDIRELTKSKRSADQQISDLQIKLAEITQSLLLAQTVAHNTEQSVDSSIDPNAKSNSEKGARVSAGPSVLGTSDAIMSVLRLCRRFAKTDSTVLVTGETGTGKEVIAGFLHAASNRNRKPMIAVNCAALPDALLESILFGHEKGSFTSADSQSIGQFETADEGTLFLDEIGEMSMTTQAKLLRAIESGQFVRVGGTTTIKVDTRIIVATNRNLLKEVAAGRFREDLYFRVNVLEVAIPPLRERRSDIRILFDAFVRHIAKRLNRPLPSITDAVFELLTQHHWPGNVRELRNVAERSVATCEAGQILPDHLPTLIRNGFLLDPEEPKDESPKKSASELLHGSQMSNLSQLEEAEKRLILTTLKCCNWNVSKTARLLDTTRERIRYRIRKFHINQYGS